MASYIPLTIIFPIVLLGACASVPQPSNGTAAVAKLDSANGTSLGSATLTRGSDGFRLEVAVTGMPPGEHGAHLHAVGTCEVPAFTSAGPHLNPFGKMHGSMNPQGSHLGDLPNLVVGADGKGTLSAQLAGSPAEIEPLIFDADGTAIVIHATADDYQTDPSGNSGSRIACGVLARQS